ncbi:MAG TPA: TetR/AcrR family transcriptional regulator [Flavitalea sp.]|nr:TetR/AcrR family transcriptional regulator [Flavitalea sp.]
MGIAERKIRQKEEVRTSILSAAWKLVVQEGWQSLSIRKIADAIEYSVPVIYDHFQNKEAILQEFTRRGFHLLTADLEKSKSLILDPARQLEALAYAYWEFAFRNKEYYQLMYGLGMPTCEAMREMDELKIFSETIRQPIRALIETSSNKNTDEFLKLQTFWSMLHGLISINMLGNDANQNKYNALILQDFIKTFISGIRD